MAESDWNNLDGALDATLIARGATTGPARPAGGGSFVFGFSSLVTTLGSVGLYFNRTNFAPLKNDAALATGGSIRGAVKRVGVGGTTGWAPFFFFCVRSGAAASPNPVVTDTGYLFGLEDANPYRIVFRKGSPSGGLPTLPTTGILRASTATFSPDFWHHLRMDVIVNPNGDVILKFFQNDLTISGASVDTPTWSAITGMTDYIDDALGVNTGSSPLSGGFAGFGMWSNALNRQGYFDHLELFRQKA